MTKELDDTPWTEPIPQLGKRLYGLGRQAAYEAARRGDIPSIRIGRKLLGLSRVAERRLSRDPDCSDD
jgi:hypothetical protein